MASLKSRRTAWATGLSLLLHVLVLTGMVMGLRVAVAPPEDRAVEVRLVPPIAERPRPSPRRAQPTPERPTAGPPLRPHLAPPPPVAVATTPLPQAAAPAEPQPQIRFQAGPLPTLNGKLGCDDPMSIHLTTEQRAVCDNRLAKLAKEARPLDINIGDKAKAEFDRNRHCREVYTRGGIPPVAELNESTGQQITGLGYNPGPKECGPQDR